MRPFFAQNQRNTPIPSALSGRVRQVHLPLFRGLVIGVFHLILRKNAYVSS